MCGGISQVVIDSHHVARAFEASHDYAVHREFFASLLGSRNVLGKQIPGRDHLQSSAGGKLSQLGRQGLDQAAAERYRLWIALRRGKGQDGQLKGGRRLLGRRGREGSLSEQKDGHDSKENY